VDELLYSLRSVGRKHSAHCLAGGNSYRINPVDRKVVWAVVVGAAQHNGCSRAEQWGREVCRGERCAGRIGVQGGERCARAETNRCNLLLCAGCCCNVSC
jgi:hypothetical protein